MSQVDFCDKLSLTSLSEPALECVDFRLYLVVERLVPSVLFHQSHGVLELFVQPFNSAILFYPFEDINNKLGLILCSYCLVTEVSNTRKEAVVVLAKPLKIRYF